MKQLKEMVLGILFLAFVVWLVTFIYSQESRRNNRELSKRISELSPHGGPPETLDGLRQAIAIYQDQIERNVRESAQTGVYWKILATRLADRALHNEALEALERAVYFNSEDPILYYLTGVSAAMVAKSKVGFSANAQFEKDQYFHLSENAYLRALQLDVTYARAMYGIGVLYVYELQRPQDGAVHLERLLQINTSDTSAMFVLASAYYMMERFSDASQMYERIAARTRDQNIKQEALNNRDIIQGMLYE